MPAPNGDGAHEPKKLEAWCRRHCAIEYVIVNIKGKRGVVNGHRTVNTERVGTATRSIACVGVQANLTIRLKLRTTSMVLIHSSTALKTMLAVAVFIGGGFAGKQEARTDKAFIDYFLPTPIVGSLTTMIWGAETVGARDPKNGLEDETMKQWNYWDGKIIKSRDGNYHLFASRWNQAAGHNGWFGSQAVHAVSDKLLGPYVDKGLCWPTNGGGRGHNVTALLLPDGRYAVVISETRPGTVFASKSPDGPWEELGKITVADNPRWHGSNECVILRPDGKFEMFGRAAVVMISANGVLGPYVAQGPTIYPDIAGMPSMIGKTSKTR